MNSTLTSDNTFFELLFNALSAFVKSNTPGNVFGSDTILAAYGDTATIVSGFSSIAEGLIPLGIMLLALHWSMSLLTQVLSKDFDIEIIIRSLLKLAIGAIIVTNSVQLFNGVVKFGDAILADVVTNANPTITAGNIMTELGKYSTDIESKKQSAYTIYNMVKSFGALCLREIVGQLIPCALIICGTTRKIELAQLFVYVPIGISDIYEGGVNSGGVQYIRKFLAVVLEPAVVIVAIAAYKTVSDGLLTIGSSFTVWAQLVAIFAAIGWIRRARKFSKQIFC